MTCESYQKTLSGFLDGNSAEAEAAYAFRHLAECEACRGFLRLAVELRHSLRAVPVPDVPAEIDRRILQIPSLEKSRERAWNSRIASFLRQRFDVPVPALAGGAGLLLIALGFSFWLLTHPGLPERQIIYVVSTPTVEVYGIRASSESQQ
jgi:predicted anti-sigma-YlaC factor YlaD